MIVTNNVSLRLYYLVIFDHKNCTRCKLSHYFEIACNKIADNRLYIILSEDLR